MLTVSLVKPNGYFRFKYSSQKIRNDNAIKGSNLSSSSKITHLKKSYVGEEFCLYHRGLSNCQRTSLVKNYCFHLVLIHEGVKLCTIATFLEHCSSIFLHKTISYKMRPKYPSYQIVQSKQKRQKGRVYCHLDFFRDILKQMKTRPCELFRGHGHP